MVAEPLARAYPAKPRRLAIVPARGGSKGVPRKNLAVVGGMTLVARAVQCARQSGLFDTILVSTDDEEIAAEGRGAGAVVPFLRPAHLATSTAALADALRDCLARLAELGEAPFHLVVTLEPTSPLRTPQVVRDVVDAAEAPGADAALSVSPVPLHYHVDKQFRLEPNGLVRHAVESGTRIVNRQELQPTYVRNGMCYAVHRQALERGCNVLGTAARAVVVEGPLVNIDDAEDLALARQLIEGNAARRA
jgi:CMP-N-acetylneuraminic acid synthetase